MNYKIINYNCHKNIRICLYFKLGIKLMNKKY